MSDKSLLEALDRAIVAREHYEKAERLEGVNADLVKALREMAQDLRVYNKPINEDGETVADIFACVLKQADAALAKAAGSAA